MAKRFKSITYDNVERDAFRVTRDDDTIIEFIPSREGLYYYDFNDSIMRQRDNDVLVVNTVQELHRNYTDKELKKVEMARNLYIMMGRPSKVDFENMLKKGKILDNPVVMDD